jgi:hypothetical protein
MLEIDYFSEKLSELTLRGKIDWIIRIMIVLPRNLVLPKWITIWHEK